MVAMDHHSSLSSSDISELSNQKLGNEKNKMLII